MDGGFHVTKRNSHVLIFVHGEVDIRTSEKLRHHLQDLIAGGLWRIIVDLGGVAKMDSTGLGVLVGALKRIRHHHGDLAVVCTQPFVLELLEATGLHRVFAIHGSVDSALAASSPSILSDGGGPRTCTAFSVGAGRNHAR